MDLDILFYIALAVIYIFSQVLGKKKRKPSPRPTSPQPGTSTGSPRPAPQAQRRQHWEQEPAGARDAPARHEPELADALAEIRQALGWEAAPPEVSRKPTPEVSRKPTPEVSRKPTPAERRIPAPEVRRGRGPETRQETERRQALESASQPVPTRAPVPEPAMRKASRKASSQPAPSIPRSRIESERTNAAEKRRAARRAETAESATEKSQRSLPPLSEAFHDAGKGQPERLTRLKEQLRNPASAREAFLYGEVFAHRRRGR